MKLSPLQSLYDDASKMMDKHEDHMKSLSDSITARIMELIKDPTSYEVDPGEQGETIANLINCVLILVHGPKRNSIDDSYLLDDAIRYILLDGQAHYNSMHDHPETVNRLCWVQMVDVSLHKAAKSELTSLLKLLDEVVGQTDATFLHETRNTNESLPARNGHGSRAREVDGMGITQKKWSEVA